MTTLTYFDIRGRAEPSRLTLEYVGANYTDKRVTFEEWPELKKTLPFGQIPYYQDEDVSIPQSIAILRHLGRKHNLYGSNNVEAAQIDVVIDAAGDFGLGIFKSADEKFHSGDKSAAKQVFVQWLDNFEGLLKDNDFFVGNSVPIADFAVFNLLDNFAKPMFKDVLEEHKKIEAFRQRIAALPKIADYLSSNRRPAITLPPFLKIVCTPEECK